MIYHDKGNMVNVEFTHEIAIMMSVYGLIRI